MSQQPDAPNAPPDEPKPRSVRDLLLGGIEEIAEFLSVFVVPETCTVEDLGKTTHTFSPVLSARRVLRATLTLNKLLSAPASEEVAAELRATARDYGRAAALQEALVYAAEDERLEAAVQDMFEMLQPDLLKAAQASAAKAELTGLDGKLASNVLDLFELDQVFEALLPFSSRVATRLAATLRKTTGSPGSSRGSPSPPSER